MVVQIKMIPAVNFYILYLTAVVVFALSPALPAQSWALASAFAVILAIATYVNYNFTLITSLKEWSISLTTFDIVWGTLVVCSSAIAGFYVAQTQAGF